MIDCSIFLESGHRPQIIVTPRKMAVAVEAAMAASARSNSSEHLQIPGTLNFADLVLPSEQNFDSLLQNSN